MTIRARVTHWLAGLSARERRLLAAAAALTLGLVATALVAGARDDLATLRARVAAREHELGEVRRLAAALRALERPDPVADASAPSVVGRLEAAAVQAVGHDRIAGMTPAGDGADDGVTLRVTGASLAEVVGLLHALAGGPPPLAVSHLALRKHTDDPARFDATVEVER